MKPTITLPPIAASAGRQRGDRRAESGVTSVASPSAAISSFERNNRWCFDPRDAARAGDIAQRATSRKPPPLQRKGALL